ncbi:MAG: hypothetical protein ILP14_04865 [Oscillospiraceae bacterium]|nr:hypothetical protein [Oscillospiraceae bacterium]
MKVPHPLEAVAILTQGQNNVNCQNESSFIFIQNQSERIPAPNDFYECCPLPVYQRKKRFSLRQILLARFSFPGYS